MTQTCPQCRGAGKIITEFCPTCNGEGRKKGRRKIQLKIPAGIEHGSHLRLRGEGEEGVGGKGDLYVLILIKPHSVFERHGQDLLCEITIPMTKAILGGEVSSSTLNGKVKMKIPAGTQGGKVFRLRNKGLPSMRTGTRGDELVHVRVETPHNLTREQQRLVEELAKLRKEDVNQDSSLGEKIKKAFR